MTPRIMTPGKRTKNRTIPITKVPSIKELCERLGFQHASLKDTSTFVEASHAWRKSYITSSGVAGTELLLWKDPDVQFNLREMSEKFLEVSNNGEAFWSANRSWNHDSDLTYPENKSKIVELLKQLFWKQNRYSANNIQYAYKTDESRARSRDKSTPVSQNAPISGALVRVGSSSNISAPSGQATSGAPSTQGPGQPPYEANEKEAMLLSHRELEDIFNGPNDSDVNRESIPFGMMINSNKHARTDQHKSPSQDGSLPKKRKKLSLGESPRRTGRKRVTLVDLDYGSGQEFEDMLLSAEDIKSKASATTKNMSQLSPNADSSSSIQKSNHIATSARPYSAPTAPMIDMSISDTDPSLPQLDVNAGRQVKMGVRSTAPKLKFVRKPQTEPQDQTQPRRTMHGSPSSSEIEPSEEPPSVDHTRYTTDHTVGVNSRQQIHPPPEQSNPSWNLDVSSTPSDPLYDEGYLNSNPPPKSTNSESRIRSVILPSKRIHDHHQPVPRTLSKPDNAKVTVSKESAAPKVRSKIQVPLWIITREPRYTEERWDEGKFQGTPLSVFIEELSQVTGRSHIDRLKLTLRTPTQDTKVTVVRGAEDSWESAKKRFVEKLKETTAEAKRLQNESATFEILVEPFYEQNVALQKSIDEVEDEFEF